MNRYTRTVTRFDTRPQDASERLHQHGKLQPLYDDAGNPLQRWELVAVFIVVCLGFYALVGGA